MDDSKNILARVAQDFSQTSEWMRMVDTAAQSHCVAEPVNAGLSCILLF